MYVCVSPCILPIHNNFRIVPIPPKTISTIDTILIEIIQLAYALSPAKHFNFTSFSISQPCFGIADQKTWLWNTWLLWYRLQMYIFPSASLTILFPSNVATLKSARSASGQRIRKGGELYNQFLLLISLSLTSRKRADVFTQHLVNVSSVHACAWPPALVPKRREAEPDLVLCLPGHLGVVAWPVVTRLPPHPVSAKWLTPLHTVNPPVRL